MDAPEVVVVGGGIVGAAAAYHLARGGVRTLLVDRADPGRASRAGAGIVCPVTATVGHDELVELAFAAAQHYPVLAGWLAEDLGDPACGFSLVGMLSVGLSAAGDERVAATAAWAGRLAATTPWAALAGCRQLASSAAPARVPVLAAELGRALLVDWGGRVDGDRFRAALLRAARVRGATVRRGSVRRLLDGGVDVDGETVPCATVVACAGAWTGRLLPGFDAVRPLRGEILHVGAEGLDTAGWPLVEVEEDGPYLVPWPGRLVVGATAEATEADEASPTIGGLRWCIEALDRVTGGRADGFRFVDSRVGFRPVSADGLPIIGAPPGRPGVLLATGHGADGLSWGPFTGQLVTELVLGERPSVDLSPFDPGRFAGGRAPPPPREATDVVYAHARRLPA